MTREEAIKWLKDHHSIDLNTQDDEAHRMAIEALEQEPCEDCISRAEVKKIAKEMYLEVANMELDAKTISDCISYTSSKCREVLESKLQDLQSIKTQEQRKGHWIEHPHECGINWEYSMYECSECHEWAEDDSDFCPNCGADMREGEE